MFKPYCVMVYMTKSCIFRLLLTLPLIFTLIPSKVQAGNFEADALNTLIQSSIIDDWRNKLLEELEKEQLKKYPFVRGGAKQRIYPNNSESQCESRYSSSLCQHHKKIWGWLIEMFTQWGWIKKTYKPNQNLLLIDETFEGAVAVELTINGKTESNRDKVTVIQNNQSFSGVINEFFVVRGNQVDVHFNSDSFNQEKGITINAFPLFYNMQFKQRKLIIGLLKPTVFYSKYDATYQIPNQKHIEVALSNLKDIAKIIVDHNFLADFEIVNIIRQASIESLNITSKKIRQLSDLTDGQVKYIQKKLSGQDISVEQLGELMHRNKKTKARHGPIVQQSKFTGVFSYLNKLYGYLTPTASVLMGIHSKNSESSSLPYKDFSRLRHDSDKSKLVRSLNPSTMIIDAGNKKVLINNEEYEFNDYYDPYPSNESQRFNKSINARLTKKHSSNTEFQYPDELRLKKTESGYYYVSDDGVYFEYQTIKKSNSQKTMELRLKTVAPKNNYGVASKFYFWDYSPQGNLVHFAEYQQSLPNTYQFEEWKAYSRKNRGSDYEGLYLQDLKRKVKWSNSPTHWITYQYLKIGGKFYPERMQFKKGIGENWFQQKWTKFLELFFHHDENDIAYFVYANDMSLTEHEATKNTPWLLSLLPSNDGEKLKTKLCNAMIYGLSLHLKDSYCSAGENLYMKDIIIYGGYAAAVLPAHLGFVEKLKDGNERFRYAPVVGFEYTMGRQVNPVITDEYGNQEVIPMPGVDTNHQYYYIVRDQSLWSEEGKNNYMPGHTYYFKKDDQIPLPLFYAEPVDFCYIKNTSSVIQQGTGCLSCSGNKSNTNNKNQCITRTVPLVDNRGSTSFGNQGQGGDGGDNGDNNAKKDPISGGIYPNYIVKSKRKTISTGDEINQQDNEIRTFFVDDEFNNKTFQYIPPVNSDKAVFSISSNKQVSSCHSDSDFYSDDQPSDRESQREKVNNGSKAQVGRNRDKPRSDSDSDSDFGDELAPKSDRAKPHIDNGNSIRRAVINIQSRIIYVLHDENMPNDSVVGICEQGQQINSRGQRSAAYRFIPFSTTDEDLESSSINEISTQIIPQLNLDQARSSFDEVEDIKQELTGNNLIWEEVKTTESSTSDNSANLENEILQAVRIEVSGGATALGEQNNGVVRINLTVEKPFEQIIEVLSNEENVSRLLICNICPENSIQHKLVADTAQTNNQHSPNYVYFRIPINYPPADYSMFDPLGLDLHGYIASRYGYRGGSQEFFDVEFSSLNNTIESIYRGQMQKKLINSVKLLAKMQKLYMRISAHREQNGSQTTQIEILIGASIRASGDISSFGSSYRENLPVHYVQLLTKALLEIIDN